VVPLLLVVGCPFAVACDAVSSAWRSRLQTLVNRPGVAFLTHPIVGYLVYAAVLIVTHLTSFMNVMVSHMWMHTFEQVLYVVAGFLFFWPLLGNDPIRWRPHYIVRLGALFAGMMPDTVVGLVLLQGNHLVAPAMSAQPRGWGPAPLADQQIAGGIMWVFGDGLMMVAIGALVLVYMARHAQSPDAGVWLENVRRSTMAGHVRLTGANADALETGQNLDDDEASLDAYNAMLKNLHERSGP
jgi:putative copper resistance protein D